MIGKRRVKFRRTPQFGPSFRIAQAVLAAILCDSKLPIIEYVVLGNYRKDCPHDNVPIIANGNWSDRLNIEAEFIAIASWAEAEIFVRLKWHTNE